MGHVCTLKDTDTDWTCSATPALEQVLSSLLSAPGTLLHGWGQGIEEGSHLLTCAQLADTELVKLGPHV